MVKFRLKPVVDLGSSNPGIINCNYPLKSTGSLTLGKAQPEPTVLTSLERSSFDLSSYQRKDGNQKKQTRRRDQKRSTRL